MTKITYLLGAGASYNACPILEKQAEMMVSVASAEITRLRFNADNPVNIDFNNKTHLNNHPNSEYKILWYMGYFGIKAKEYNTIDTYAKKLYLNKEEEEEYKLLKMTVSIFFDLWENFYHKKFKLNNDEFYNKNDNRYKSLFSVLLDNENNTIKLNSNFKFITWNYDLQLEETFRLFVGDIAKKDLDYIDLNNFKFKKDNKSINNDVFHLNGHRGYFKEILENNEKEVILNYSNNIDLYWDYLQNIFPSTFSNNVKFDYYINYAWEHDLNNDSFFKKIVDVLNETEILIIIGYSFPAFNRKIDQFLLSKLNTNKLKKIVYQDPNATEQMISNLFEKPLNLKNKIEIINNKKSMNQFHMPNDYFIIQKENLKGPRDFR